LQALYLAGERATADAVWANELLGKPIVDHGGDRDRLAITAGFRVGLFAFKPGSGGGPCPATIFMPLDDDGNCATWLTGNLSLRFAVAARLAGRHLAERRRPPCSIPV